MSTRVSYDETPEEKELHDLLGWVCVGLLLFTGVVLAVTA